PKYISKVPHSPNYPNNCNSDCFTNGYILGYFKPSSTASSDNTYYSCGKKRVTGYSLYFIANDKKINLPIFEYFDGVGYINYGTFGNTILPYVYCIAQ
ncbi:hypothetical protein H7X65_00505, partial [Candidatus Parcubacteria bacterium]|nr:hypothetical protein [Candidatus Parcubacteria bacterium]